MTEKLKVLVVEDDLLIGADIKRSIQLLGYAVIGVVSTGEQVLEMMETVEPDVIVMDIVLKGRLNGIDTAMRIHKRRPVPIIFLTAYGDEITRQKVLQVKPCGYIIKPFHLDELRRAIEVAADQCG